MSAAGDTQEVELAGYTLKGWVEDAIRHMQEKFPGRTFYYYEEPQRDVNPSWEDLENIINNIEKQ